MAIQNVSRRCRAAWFDGVDPTDVIALHNEAFAAQGGTFTAASGGISGGVLTVNAIHPAPANNYSLTIFANTWTVSDNGNVTFSGPQSDMDFRFNTTATIASNIAPALLASDAFKQSLSQVAGGFGSMASITVNGLSNANFDVPIRPMQTSNSFTAVPVLTGSASLLGSLSVSGLTAGAAPNANKLTTVINGVTWYDRVRVNVVNSGALQLSGAALLVHVSP